MTWGIFVVAFGAPARESAVRLMKSIKKYMPDIPIALAGMGANRAGRWRKEHPDIPIAKSDIGPLGIEDIFLDEYDSDIGGRRVKLRGYELCPAEWDMVLYLDADTELVAPVPQFFQWLSDGWEFVICTDLDPTLHSFSRRAGASEMTAIQAVTGSLHVLPLNGGVWAFRRCDRVAAFFVRWRMEYEKFVERDQGALLRALYTGPLRLWLLGLEWNTFVPHCHDLTTAGIRHHVGEARRWAKMIRGRLDGATVWASVRNVRRLTR